MNLSQPEEIPTSSDVAPILEIQQNSDESYQFALFYGRIIEFREYDKNWKNFKVMHIRELSLQNVSRFIGVALDPALRVTKDANFQHLKIKSLDMLDDSVKLTHYKCHGDEKLNFFNEDLQKEINKYL